MSDDREIVVGEAADGDDVTLPVVELLTGRGFVTGKSGSGKSNTASVLAEELLEAGFPLLIVDTDGEYYGLKEEYEMLHAGADEECDIQIGPEHAEQMATLALEENVPIILDVSGYLDEDVADELLRKTARQLFVKEKKLKKPFLLVVEEVHEYIPEGGGVGETGKLLIKIGKRGRKHGLGILGISQRPADVKKDFITQANWLVWHRLTWDNDTKVVGRIIDTEYTERVSELDDGQAFVQTDWTETDVRKVQFRRKRTFDAGATPGLDDFERPELKSVSDALVGELQEISERKQSEQSRIEELESELEKREQRIATLEDKLAAARDVSNAAEQMAQALRQPDTVQTQLPDVDEELRRLHDEVVELERERDELREELAARDEEIESLEESLEERTKIFEEENASLRVHVAERADIERELEAQIAELEGKIETLTEESEWMAQASAHLSERLGRRRERIAELESALETQREEFDEERRELEERIDALETEIVTDESDERRDGEPDDNSEDDSIIVSGGDEVAFGYSQIDTDADDDILVPTDDVGSEADRSSGGSESGPASGPTVSTEHADAAADRDQDDESGGDGTADRPAEIAAADDESVEKAVVDDGRAVKSASDDESVEKATVDDGRAEKVATDEEPSDGAIGPGSVDGSVSTGGSESIVNSGRPTGATAWADAILSDATDRGEFEDNGAVDSEAAPDGTQDGEDDSEETPVSDPPSGSPTPSALDDRITVAADGSRCDVDTAYQIVETLHEDGGASAEALAGDVSRSPIAVQSLLSELRVRGVLDRTASGTYSLEADVRASLSSLQDD
ncbi:DUF87 domain-containing protein [Halobacteria archaeon AArc-dxtr1]|nr:DUF87 domain-containing protein [Halobacteria archaeon AArc-dxtr1]